MARKDQNIQLYLGIAAIIILALVGFWWPGLPTPEKPDTPSCPDPSDIIGEVTDEEYTDCHVEKAMIDLQYFVDKQVYRLAYLVDRILSM